MIEPGELHRYFIVREIATGADVRILGGDTRYAVTGSGVRDYRASPDGDRFLAKPAVRSHPWGRPVRLEEVEPLPDGRGLWHPDAHEHNCHLAPTYDGSFRQMADRLAQDAESGCTELDCPACQAPAGKPCEVWCIADQATADAG